jgi:WD40 repeat protein
MVLMALSVRECHDEEKLGIDTIVSASTDKTARIWKWMNGDLKCVNVLRGHTGQIYCLQFDPSSRLIVTGGGDSEVRVWHEDTGIAVVLQSNRYSIVYELYSHFERHDTICYERTINE